MSLDRIYLKIYLDMKYDYRQEWKITEINPSGLSNVQKSWVEFIFPIHKFSRYLIFYFYLFGKLWIIKEHAIAVYLQNNSITLATISIKIVAYTLAFN